MRFITVVACLVVALVITSCGGSSSPAAPTAVPQATSDGAILGSVESTASDAGVAGAAVGLAGVVRGFSAGSATFSLVTRTGTRTIVTDAESQLWKQGSRMRLSALANGQSVSIRGVDYTRYVLARTISVN